jgi:DNA-binding transcriptional MerR regulator
VTDVTQDDGADGGGNGKDMTVDELARRAGMTVRNVRAHQSRGLLQAPEVRGRTGYYGDNHLARLEFIKELQAEGFNLEAIRRIIENAPEASSQEALDFTRALTTAFTEERPEVISADQLAEPWGDEATPELARRVERLGLVRDLGDGRFEIRSPRLRQASEELVALGVPLDTAIDVLRTLRRHSEAVAKAYASLFVENVWRPFEEAEGEDADWHTVREAFERLRPLAAQSLLATFQLVMADTVERAMERELARIAEQGQRRRGRHAASRRGRARRSRDRHA